MVHGRALPRKTITGSEPDFLTTRETGESGSAPLRKNRVRVFPEESGQSLSGSRVRAFPGAGSGLFPENRGAEPSSENDRVSLFGHALVGPREISYPVCH